MCKRYLVEQLKVNRNHKIEFGRWCCNREQNEYPFELQLFEINEKEKGNTFLKFASWCDLSDKSCPFLDYSKLLYVDFSANAVDILKSLQTMTIIAVLGICHSLRLQMNDYLDTDRLSIRYLPS
ncbi:hypothetical protein RFI_06874 [Reticulomyxa filosa]|uniref:Uncharacterized protein n=1 Tax=Reticulomyxa filosa TaxID=46433 RepID=X6NY75_RETFI|nr:hypothetical protein RFI_06874 [Reticulomyxa filosa]|eukprot:ETO30247.1 hypothetical protein RFI_06874 [Reticulomyxa filosa]